MQEVNIDKSRLLQTLRENKQKHEEAFHEAITAFYEKFTVSLEEIAQGVRAKKLNFEGARKLFNEWPPEGHCDEYERAITMLEFEEHDIISLSAHEFNQYVLDEWGWKGDFAASYHTHTLKTLGS